MDSTQIFTAKEVRSKLETVKLQNVHSTPPSSASLVLRESAPLLDGII
jgi:hypothetical protein